MIDVRHRQLERLRYSVADSPAILDQVRSAGISQRLRANLELSLKDTLHLSMLTSAGERELQQRLAESAATPMLRELIEVCSALRPTLADWQVPSYTIDLIAIPLFLDQKKEARLFHSVVLEGASCTRLWDEYSRGLGALLSHSPFTPSTSKNPRGLEKHWAMYLPWIATRSVGADAEQEEQAIAASLAHYNTETKIRDAGVFDPSGLVPQRWDGRLKYLWRAADA